MLPRNYTHRTNIQPHALSCLPNLITELRKDLLLASDQGSAVIPR
jgi:hypothetical protein